MSLPTPPPVPEDTLLLAVDLQTALVAVMPDSLHLEKRCRFALAAAVGLGLPVRFTEQVPQKLGPTLPSLRAAAPAAGVLAKSTFSALADAGIRHAILEERDVRHLLICGLETPVCVYQTAADALAAGLQVTLLSDCLGARRADDARACLDALIRAGAHVLPSETVFYALLRDATHPFFRSFTQLVKAAS
jgi:hypothetical protein